MRSSTASWWSSSRTPSASATLARPSILPSPIPPRSLVAWCWLRWKSKWTRRQRTPHDERTAGHGGGPTTDTHTPGGDIQPAANARRTERAREESGCGRGRRTKKGGKREKHRLSRPGAIACETKVIEEVCQFEIVKECSWYNLTKLKPTMSSNGCSATL